MGKSLATFFFLLLVLLPFFYWLTAAGIALTILAAINFINRLGEGTVVFELLLLVSCIQWLFAPSLEYLFFNNHFKYFMAVSESEYMAMVFPALFTFYLLIEVFYKRLDFQVWRISLEGFLKSQKGLGYKLIIAGAVSIIINPFAPGFLGFVMYLGSNLLYVGLLYEFFTPEGDSQGKWKIIVFGVAVAFLRSLSNGMFHDLILWGLFFFIFYALKYQLSLYRKLLIICVGLMSIYTIQLVKHELRENIKGGNSSGLFTFFQLTGEKLEGEEEFVSSSIYEEMNVRLNQGWIISAIMENVPKYEPFADGETIEEAIYSSALPRFLNPNKKMAGGRENFERFTGLQIRSNTSMGTSILGEAYANYGHFGTVIFMLVWGGFLVIYYNRLISFVKNYPTILLWIPLLFFQVVKAETELVVVLNHLVKASIFVFGVYWISRKVFNVQL